MGVAARRFELRVVARAPSARALAEAAGSGSCAPSHTNVSVARAGIVSLAASLRAPSWPRRWTASTASACPSTFTLENIWAILPSGPMSGRRAERAGDLLSVHHLVAVRSVELVDFGVGVGEERKAQALLCP